MQREQVQVGGDDWFRYALALEASQEGFWDWDLVADRLWGSTRWQSITGISFGMVFQSMSTYSWAAWAPC